MSADDPIWQALQALALVALVLFIGVQALPGLQRWRRQIVGAALAIYLAGGAAIAVWYFTR